MNKESNLIGEIGIQFFGKISASMSHEFKNVLAVINENAGLLDDFTVMAEKGIPIDPNRLKTLAEKITKQIHRANELIKNMNKFAHSADESLTTGDIGEILNLVLVISERFAAMRNITLKFIPPQESICITTNPFFLETIVFLCLNFAMDAVGSEKLINLAAEKTESGARIRFTPLENITESLKKNNFPADRENTLLALLKAEITADVSAKEIVLNLPQHIGD